MLKEAIQSITNLVEECDKATLIEEAVDGRSATYSQRGKRFEIERSATVRDHNVHTLDDLIRIAGAISPPAEKLEGGVGGTVFWHGPAAVVLIVDDADRRDRVAFGLDFSKAFCILREAVGHPFQQAEFLRFLRALDVDSATVAVFRRLDFTVIQAAEGDIQHGKERLGKTINAEVKGTTDLPEEMTVAIPVYSNKGERAAVSILCTIDLDPQRALIHFEPKGDELAEAIDSAQDSISTRLVDAFGDDRVFYGKV